MDAPKSEKLKIVFLILQDFLLEFLYMLISPIIRHAFESQLHEHPRPRRWPSLFGVEWHDAPGDESVLGKIALTFRFCSQDKRKANKDVDC